MGAVLQVLANGLIAGSTYALLGVAMGLIIGVTGRFHVAFAMTYALAAFVAAWLGTSAHVPFWPAVVSGGLAAGLTGALIDRYVYWPILLRTGADGLLMIFVASLAVSIVGRSGLSFAALQSSATVVDGFTNAGVSIGPVTLSSLAITTAISSWACIVCVELLLLRTKIGRSIRAVRANVAMAICVGIEPGSITFVVFAVGSFLGGVAGVFQAAATSASADMGISPLFYGLVIAFVAGRTSRPLVVAAVGLGLGLLESLTTLVLPTAWTTVFVFALLFVFVALRPLRVRGSEA